MVAATHGLRFASRRIPPYRSRVRIALSVAPARDAFEKLWHACAAHAKGAHADEHPAHQRHLGRGRRDGAENSARHCRRGAQWSSAGRDEECAHSCYR